MTKYYTLEIVDPSYVIYAYRGTESDNTLEVGIPLDDQATNSFTISTGLSESELDQIVIREVLPIAQSNPGRQLLLRVTDSDITVWLI